MEENPIIDNHPPVASIYKDNAIFVGTFLGGPLAAGYLIAENFKAFDQPGNARKTWIFAILLTLLIFGSLFLIPATEDLPNQVIPIVYTLVIISLVRRFQGAKIASHISSGGKLFSWWRTLGVGLIGLCITIIPIAAYAYYTEVTGNADLTVKTYGSLKHEIEFDKNNITEHEVDRIAEGLKQTTFFDEAEQKFIYLAKAGESYELSISCNNTIKDNPEALTWFTKLRNELQALFPNHKIVLKLVVDNLDNVVKRLE